MLFVNQNFVDFFKSQLQDLPRLEDREGQVELYLPPQAKQKPQLYVMIFKNG